MGGVVARGLHSRAWAQPAPGAQAARAAAYLMQGQVEAGTLCPTTMTFAAVPLLQREPAGVVDFGGDWLPALYSREFDGADALTAKRGALIGMGLTEKQGGSDLRAISTRATPLGARRGCAYQLVGHKWFYSVPQADAHLVLAQADEGPSCFFVPRWIPGGPRNAVRAPPEGQTGQPQQRQRRGRVRGRLGRDGGRAGPPPTSSSTGWPVSSRIAGTWPARRSAPRRDMA